MIEVNNTVIFRYDDVQINVPLACPWNVYTGIELKKQFCKDYSQMVDRSIDDLSYFTLHITEKCNLNCLYCFEKKKSNTNISIDNIKLFIEMIKKRKLKNINIRLFGGEPLIELDLLENILSLLNKELVMHGVNVKYNMFTNGTLLSKRALKIISKYNIFVYLSIDGYKESHDKNRLTKDGKGTFDTIINNISDLKKVIGNRLVVRTILDPYSEKKSLGEIKKELYSKGIDVISIEFPWVERTSDLSLNTENLKKMKNYIKEYGYEYIESIKSNNYSITGVDPFSKIIGGLLNKNLYMSSRACGAGVSSVAISSKGEIYPCHAFVGNNKYKMGDLFNDINNNRVYEKFLKYSADSIKTCSRCEIKYICLKRCPADSVLFNNCIDEPNKYRCELQKQIFKTSMYIFSVLSEMPENKRILKLIYNRVKNFYSYS